MECNSTWWSHHYPETQFKTERPQRAAHKRENKEASRLISRVKVDKKLMIHNLRKQMISEERFQPSKNSRVRRKKQMLRLQFKNRSQHLKS